MTDEIAPVAPAAPEPVPAPIPVAPARTPEPNARVVKEFWER